MGALNGSKLDRLLALFAPAVAVMNHLTYPRKFALISLLFALPLGLVMYLLISEINGQIEFAQKEMYGTAYLRPLRHLHEHVSHSRLLAHDYTRGKIALRPELIRTQAEIDAACVALAEVDRELGQVLKATAKYDVLAENERFLKAKLLSLEPDDAGALHTQLLADIRALISHVGDTSNLILDPDLDSYYLMDSVLLKLPDAADLTGRLAYMGKNMLAPGKTLTADEKAEFIRVAGLLRSNLEETHKGLNLAFTNNPAQNLKARLARPLQDYVAATESFLQMIERETTQGRALQVTPAAYEGVAGAHRAACMIFWDEVVLDLDGLLATRTAGFVRKKQLVQVLAVVALALVGYLLVAFYLGVMQTVTSLRQASERMVDGSLDHVVTLQTRDELGQVVTSFNNIAVRLRTEWTVAREESARATAAESSLREAKEVAEQATRAKSIFLATMSHEIRTPLNAVLGMSSLLQDTELTAQQQEFAQVIRTSGEALLGVINDILDFSKIEAGHLELEHEPLDVRSCIEGAMDVIAARGAEKGLELAYQMDADVPPWIMGDVTRLRQILINLLSNAVKFTERGEVVVYCQLQKDKADAAAAPGAHGSQAPLYKLQFEVRDTGIGIPADRVARLFQSFSQVDASTTRKYGGTGLGLVICKRLAEMMGGRMWVTSTPGEGSTFHFTVVAPHAAAPVEHVNRLADLPDPTTKRLLIVDDNDVNRRILTQVAEGWGFPTRATGSPLEALRWLEAGERFDLGILDIAMPEMDGVALAAAIRQRYTAQQMPLVAFTSLTRQEALGDRREFEAFVTKPLKPAYLLEVLIGVLSGSGTQQMRPRSSRKEFDATLGQRLPLRILVAEDVAVNQQMMRVMLGRMAYAADFADNGVSALEALERRQYDLILMDMQMPEMDGLQCTRALVGRYPAEHRPKIVALTANVTAEDAQQCKAAGMDDFLTKPIKPLELRKCLERWGEVVAGQRSEPASHRPEVKGPTTEAEVPLIDAAVLADLRELDADEPGLLQSFVEGFQQEVPEHVALMHQAIAAGECEELRKLAHRLKGTAANLGASGVADRCNALEAAGRAGLLSGGATVLAELELRYQQTNAFFAGLGASAPQGQSTFRRSG